MTRIAVLSDAHGNLPALEAAAAHARGLSVDVLLHAGDMVNGPASAEVLDYLTANGIPGVFGNHEEYVLDCTDADASDTLRSDRFASVRWTRGTLSDAHLAQMASWPVTLQPHPDVTVLHGSTQSLRARLAEETTDDEVLAMYRDIHARAIVSGHTHLPHIRRLNGTVFVNAGSTGRPVDDDGRAAYALLTKGDGAWQAEIMRVPYDTRPVLDAARRLGGWLEGGGGFAAIMLHEMLEGRRWGQPFLRWWNKAAPGLGVDDAYRAFARHVGADPLI